MNPITESRFNALAFKPMPAVHKAMYQELEWYEAEGERLLGAVVLDRTDHDYSWVVLCQDNQGKYRSPASATSLPTQEAAREALAIAMQKAAATSDAELRAAQNQNPGGLTDDEQQRVLEVMAWQEDLLRRGR
jgi:hypothetical protein